MALLTTITNTLNFALTTTVNGVEGEFKPRFGSQVTRESGTAIDQSQALWYAKARSIAAATNDDIDLSGVQLSAFGASVALTKVKGVYIRNLSVVVGDVLNIGAGSNAFLLFANSSDIYKLGPGGTFFIEEPSLAGLPVTAGTGDILRINNPGANIITFDIAIWGV